MEGHIPPANLLDVVPGLFHYDTACSAETFDQESHEVIPGIDAMRADGAVTEMDHIDPAVSPLVQVTDERTRHFAAQTELRVDVRERQRSILSGTFPGWAISYGLDLAGGLAWTADLQRPPTPEMVTAGVQPKVVGGDPIQLMAALTWQTWVIQSVARSSG